MVFTRIIKSIKKNPLISILITLFLAAIFTLLALLSSGFAYEEGSFKITNIETFLEYNQYTVTTQPNKQTVVWDEFMEGQMLKYEDDPDTEKVAEYAAIYDSILASIEEFYSLQSEDFIFITESSTSKVILDYKGTDDINIFKKKDSHYVSTRDFYKERFAESGYTEEDFENAAHVDCVMQTDEFFEYENLTFVSGNNLSEEDLNYTQICTEENPYLILPVILGYDYYGYYELGETFYLFNQIYDENRWKRLNGESEAGDIEYQVIGYRIVGFLSEDTVLSNFSGYTYLADSYIIAPKNRITEEFTVTGELSKASALFRLCLFFTTSKFYINRDLSDYYVSEITSILQKNNVYELFYPRNAEFTNKVNTESYTQKYNNYVFASVIVIIFSLGGLIGTIIGKFKSNIKAYAIHIMVGSMRRDIVFFSMVEMFFYVLLANIIIFWPAFLGKCFGYIPNMNLYVSNFASGTLLLWVILFADIVILLITAAVTWLCVRRHDLAEIIKGKE